MAKQNLAGKVGIVTIGTFFLAFSRIVVEIVLVRILSQAAYGTFRQVWLVYFTLSAIIIIGIPQSAYVFIAILRGEKQSQFIRQTIGLLMVIGLGLGLVFLFLGGFIANKFNNPELALLLRLFSLYPVFTISTEYYLPLLISLERHKRAAVMSILFALAYALPVLIPLLLGFSLATTFTSIAVVAAIKFFLVLWDTWRMMEPVSALVDFSLLKQQLTFTLPLGVASLLGILSEYLDKNVVSLFFTVEMFAIFSVGTIKIPLIDIFPYQITNILLPKFSRLYSHHKEKQMLALWHESMKKISLIMFPTFFYLMFFSDKFITFFFTDAYSQSAAIFRIYLLTLPLRLTAHTAFLQAFGNTRPVMMGNLLNLAVTITLCLVFVKAFGLWGPALATVLATYGQIAFYVFKIKSTLSLSLRTIMPWNYLIRVFALSFISGLVTSVVNLLIYSKLGALSVGALVFTSVFIILLLTFGLLTPRDKEIIRKWWVTGLQHRRG